MNRSIAGRRWQSLTSPNAPYPITRSTQKGMNLNGCTEWLRGSLWESSGSTDLDSEAPSQAPHVVASIRLNCLQIPGSMN